MLTLRFTYNPTLYNRLIRLFTWYDYTHVDVMYSNGLCISALPDKGVRIHARTAKKQKFMTLDVDENIVIRYMESQIGKKYDWLGIFGIPFRRNWQEDDKWFCSELIAAAINKARPTFSEASAKITPRDIALVCKDKI